MMIKCFNVSFFLILFCLTSCQQATRVNDISNSKFEYLQKKLDEPILLGEKTVIFDSRSKMDYMMYSLPGAIHLTWDQLVSDPSIDNSVVKGDKAYYTARKLARLGVGPESEVIVVGKRDDSQASSGRLAWSLLVLGFKNVQVTSMDALSDSVTAFKERKHKSIPIWKPKEKAFLEVNQNVFIEKLKKGNNDLLVLDVRSEDEMKKVNLKTIKSKTSNFKSVYIPWRFFYNKKGRPDKGFIKRLTANDVTPDKEIIVISNEGVRSGSVSYALLSLGFSRVFNFSAGYKSFYK